MDNKILSFKCTLYKRRPYLEDKVFICFAAEDRYRIAEAIVYHLKNYGIDIWYDRYSLLMGDNRIEKNLIDGASKCKYAIIIISEFTVDSPCTMEELSIIKKGYETGNIFIFPVLYEILPESLSIDLLWIKDLIFKEANKSSGTYEICNHIACKITGDILKEYRINNIQNIVDYLSDMLPLATYAILKSYQETDAKNLNSRVALLYSAYITIKVLMKSSDNRLINMISCIFKRLFSETKLNLEIDYREIWLLENSICIMVNQYINYGIESRI